MPKECLPEHLKNKRHDDWLWPFKYIPRAWNAHCGEGPLWDIGGGYQPKPVPEPGYRSRHTWDRNGASRPYSARTFKNGFHIRRGYRWDDVDHYYNWVLISFGFEYKDGKPI